MREPNRNNIWQFACCWTVHCSVDSWLMYSAICFIHPWVDDCMLMDVELSLSRSISLSFTQRAVDQRTNVCKTTATTREALTTSCHCLWMQQMCVFFSSKRICFRLRDVQYIYFHRVYPQRVSHRYARVRLPSTGWMLSTPIKLETFIYPSVESGSNITESNDLCHAFRLSRRQYWNRFGFWADEKFRFHRFRIETLCEMKILKIQFTLEANTRTWWIWSVGYPISVGKKSVENMMLLKTSTGYTDSLNCWSFVPLDLRETPNVYQSTFDIW